MIFLLEKMKKEIGNLNLNLIDIVDEEDNAYSKEDEEGFKSALT